MASERASTTPSSILFVHQGYELYGSDRTLIQSVSAAATRWPAARITVLLPCDGALREALLPIVQDVRIADLAILRKGDLNRARLKDARVLLAKVQAARRMMRSYAVTYINTAMVIDYILAASITRAPCILHVHEMPTGLAAIFFSCLLLLSRAFLVFNSSATRRSFAVGFWQRRAVVWNGVAQKAELPEWPSHASLHLLLIGRLNAWKGQAVLLRAMAHLPEELRMRVRVRLVGGVFRDKFCFRDRLIELIEELKLKETTEVIGFTSDPQVHYAWSDVVVVPSTRPEPFGLVAIEAMAAGRCVIAANHGGIAEVVVDGVTGSLVTPESVGALADAIEIYLKEPARVHAEGAAGRKRFEEQFEESRYKTKIAGIIEEAEGKVGPPSMASHRRQSIWRRE